MRVSRYSGLVPRGSGWQGPGITTGLTPTSLSRLPLIVTEEEVSVDLTTLMYSPSPDVKRTGYIVTLTISISRVPTLLMTGSDHVRQLDYRAFLGLLSCPRHVAHVVSAKESEFVRNMHPFTQH